MELALTLVELALLVVLPLFTHPLAPPPEFLNEVTGVPAQGQFCIDRDDLPQQEETDQ